MALTRKLFINWHTRRRQRSDASGGPDVVDRLTFAKYDTVPFYVVLVEPDPDTPGPNNFNRVDITDLSLSVRINDTLDDAAPLVEQATWTKVTADNSFRGNLVLSTAVMNTYMSAERTPYFEVEVTDGTGARIKVLVEPCLVIIPVGQTVTTSPDPTQEYYTAAQIRNMFVSRILGPGETLTFQDVNSAGKRILGLREDLTPQDDIIV